MLTGERLEPKFKSVQAIADSAPYSGCPSNTTLCGLDLRHARGFQRCFILLGVPEKITIDKSGANTAAIEGIRADSGADIEMRQSKYLNSLIEQDHRAVKRIVLPMLGFKNFRCARALIDGIETMHMIKKGQLDAVKDRASSAANQFHSLAF